MRSKTIKFTSLNKSFFCSFPCIFRNRRFDDCTLMVESIIWETKKKVQKKSMPYKPRQPKRNKTKRLRDVEELWKERKWRQKKIAFNERFYFQLSIWSIVNDHFCQFLFFFYFRHDFFLLLLFLNIFVCSPLNPAMVILYRCSKQKG